MKQQKKSISKGCPYGECDGSGLIYDKETNVAKFCRCKTDKANRQLIEFADIPKEFENLKVNDFEIDIYKTDESKRLAAIAKKASVKYVQEFEKYQVLGKGLYFYSYVKGSGKTRLAASVTNAIIRMNNVKAKFITTIDLFAEIRMTFNNKEESADKLIKLYKDIDVLILDDFGAENQSSWALDVLFSIINARMNEQKVTLVTSNIPLENTENDRILSRLNKMCIQILLPEESTRFRIAEYENEQLAMELFK